MLHILYKVKDQRNGKESGREDGSRSRGYQRRICVEQTVREAGQPPVSSKTNSSYRFTFYEVLAINIICYSWKGWLYIGKTWKI